MLAGNGDMKVRKEVFYPMAAIFIGAIALGIAAPEAFYKAENAIVEFAFVNFGWLFQLSSVMFLAICTYLGFSKYGDIKFGGKDAKPTLTNWQWFSISLCGGIATGILFWGIAEPITHFMNPPDVLGLKPQSEGAAMFSMVTTFIHWTFIPYSMYGIAGLGIAYCAYNMGLPYSVSSTLYPLFGNRTRGTVSALVDNICLLAIAGGVAAVLGVGAMQAGSGLQTLMGIKTGKTVWAAVLAITVTIYVVSSYSGIMRGIRILSDYNAKIFLLMMLFFFVVGPTSFILNLGVQSFGHFLDSFFERTMFLSPIDGSPWPRWWPVYYWAIWLAYAPLIGMFLARLSYGRTVRQFLLFNVVLPSVFGLLWFSIFGGNAIHSQIHGGQIWDSIQKSGLEVSVFAFLKNYPLGTAWSWIFISVLILSIVTLCDSMTTTVASLSMTGSHLEGKEPPAPMKIFWGITMASMAIINLLSSSGKISGIDATKQIATVAGFPILFFMCLMAMGTARAIMKGMGPVDQETDPAEAPEGA
ncbi:BCCT family transporter [Thermanaerovibrio acidaminovorans]|uniref:BCCT family transporter n=2 Tax=Thermanaerovibrio acidaminovorans TaxID=81462 RepID=UPI00248F697B|nr:BCCT family transporter [Thermanaerovibrio acidaminovorans]